MSRSPFDDGRSPTHPVHLTAVRDPASGELSHPDSVLDRLNRQYLRGAVDVDELLARVLVLASRPKAAHDAPPRPPLVRTCKECHQSFEQPSRQGRPLERCNPCRGEKRRAA